MILTSSRAHAVAGLWGAKVEALPPVLPKLPIRIFPQNGRIWDFAQTSDGLLWLGGSQGLLTYDGSSFVAVEGSTEPRGEIRAIELMPDRTLFVAGIQGLWRREPGAKHFSWLGNPGGGTIALAAKGNDVWVGTIQGLYFTRGHQLGLLQGSATLSISGLKTTGMGDDVWVGTTTGISEYTNGKLHTHWSGSEVHAFARTKDGTWYAGAATAGLLERNATGTWEPVHNGWTSDPTVLCLATDAQGDLWVGTTGGLVQQRNTTFEMVTDASDLPSARVQGLFFDEANNAWLGLDGNAIAEVRRDLDIQSFPSPVGQLPFALTKTVDGAVWMSMGHKLSRWSNGSVIEISPTKPDVWTLRSIQSDSKGAVWVGDFLSGLMRVTAKGQGFEFQDIPLDEGHLEGISTVYVAPDDTVWLGLHSGSVLERRGSTMMRHEATIAGCPAGVTRMLQYAAGELLVATNGAGLCLLHTATGQFEQVGENSERNLPITTLSRLANGEVWAGSLRNGVGRLVNKRLRWVGYDQGLRAELVGAILEDKAHNVWLTARSGIFRIPEGELQTVVEGKQATVEPLVFTTAEGVLSTDSISGWADPSIIDDNGSLWVVTLRGPLVVNHPERLVQSPWHRPEVSAVTINGVSLSPHPDGQLQAPVGRGNIEFHYAASAISEGRRLQYQYRLEGFDRDWIEAGDRKVAFYTNLTPGPYRFRLRAKLSALAPAKEGAPVALELVPPFYRTAAFYALCAVGVVLLMASIMRLRGQGRRKQQKLLADERRRISQDIHDSLEQTFVAMRFQVDVARRTLPAEEPAQGALDRTMSLMNRAMKETRAAIWSLRAEFPGRADLVTQLAIVAGEAGQGQGLKVKLNTEGQAFDLPVEIQRQALQITREALSNAMKHAHAQNVLVQISFAPSEVVIKVQDDGQGFLVADAASLAGHYGLSGMRERAQQIHAQLAIKSEAQQGTTIMLTIPRPVQKRTSP